MIRLYRPSRTLLLLGILILTAGFIRAQTPVAVQQPNIVIILADDLGWADVSYHGDEIATPHIDRLAREGVRLERFYVAPVCSPTRAGLLTGRYPDRYGMREGVIAPFRMHGLPPAEWTLAEMLADAGYSRRAVFGKWHLGHSSTKYHPLNQGFTEFYGHYNGAIDYFTHKRDGEVDWHRNFETSKEVGYSTDLLTREAIRFIQASGPGEPFFLYLPYNAVHSPMQAPLDHLDHHGFELEGPRLEHTGGQRAGEADAEHYGRLGNGNTTRQTYKAMVTAMDEQIGLLLETLEHEGLADDTLVFFLSDNGGTEQYGGNNQPLRGGKFTVWEGGVRVPAVMRWPAGLPGGRTVDAPLAYVDILPTFQAIAGGAQSPPNTLDGCNMFEVIRGEATAPERAIYLGQGAVVRGRWKLNGDELYDLQRDPYEQRDVAGEHGELVEELAKRRAEFEALKVEPAETGRFETPPDWKIPEDE